MIRKIREILGWQKWDGVESVDDLVEKYPLTITELGLAILVRRLESRVVALERTVEEMNWAIFEMTNSD